MAPPSTEAVWSLIGNDLRRFIRRRVSDDHLAEDLLQETFVRIHRNLRTLEDTARLPAWVYQIARNVITDHFRKPAVDGVSLGEVDPAEEQSPSSSCQPPSCEWRDELIRQLPEAYREALLLSEFEGLTQQEVADRLGLSLPGAKSRIQRGRAMLKDVLEQCCTLGFDRRGNLVEVDPRPDRTVCRNCGDHD